jgi:Ca2+-transporting ATPase
VGQIKKAYYRLSADEVAHEMRAHEEHGLTSTEAAQRLKQFGANILHQKKPISPLKLFLSQFNDVLIIILMFAAVVSLGVGQIEEGGSMVEGILIFIIVIAIAIVGFLNEFKAEKTVEALRKLVAQKAKVRRDGEVIEIDAKDVVPGDIAILEEGQKIPADIRLTKIISLRVDEASLTGESVPVNKREIKARKDLPLGDQVNMAFSGTSITSGKGEGVVVATGGETEIGKIARLVDEEVDEQTPMQRKLDQLGKQLGYGVIAICAVVFAFIFFFDKDLIDHSFIQRLLLAFTAAIALAVAAIPEGLAFVVRISLALGARRMAEKNALVRKLSAVETLGSTDIICSDKTGTLTRGQMTVREIWTDKKAYQVSGSGYDTKGNFLYNGKKTKLTLSMETLLSVGMWCNDARLEKGKVIGDSTEAALVVSARKAGLRDKELPRIEEVPFSSDRKLMSTVHHRGKSRGYMVATKGATEVLLDCCNSILIGGKHQRLTKKLKEEIIAQNEEMSKNSLRVLGFAYKKVSTKVTKPHEIESNLTFVGLQGMMDPPRKEIKEVIETVTNESGMRVVMITGDYIETAKAVAAEVGITGEAISGPELDKISQDEFKERVLDISVYARVNPEHKLRIVNALKHHGLQVAMTGDGVNDAPAIKAADIGIAMGVTGTDVSKEAADLILLDDQFMTIIQAIEEGRGIFDNVRKFVTYLLSANIAEVITVLFGLIFFGKLVLTAVQLLFINVVTDGLPAIALGSDPSEKGIMKYKPKRFQSHIINNRIWVSMTIFGFLMAAIILWRFEHNLAAYGLTYAISVAFTAMVILEMVRLIDIRSYYDVQWKHNPWLVIAIMSSIALQLLVLNVPWLSELFGVESVRLVDWAIILISGLFLFLAMKAINAGIDRLIPEFAAREKRRVRTV